MSLADHTNVSTLAVGVASLVGALGLAGWYLYRDQRKHQHQRLVKHRVHHYTHTLRGIHGAADAIWLEYMEPILPLLDETNPQTRAAAMVADFKRLDHHLGLTSELLLRKLEDMDGIPLRKVLEPTDPKAGSSTSAADAADYEPSELQQEALAKLKERRRNLARFLNKQLAIVDGFSSLLKAAMKNDAPLPSEL
ncbi:hypothetical protein H4R33_003389 [Dimargaris cristalligena]|nr:hypothetical protein H4R33_003389 [Dimargaris cristalligena]